MNRLRLLLYVTTHMSSLHKSRLVHFWNMTHPALASADVLFYTPSKNWEELRRSFPNASFFDPPSSVAYDYQKGAMAAMTDNRSLSAFKAYDWVIRLNPDVTICSFDETYRYMTSEYDVLAGYCGPRIMTDFTVFRPSALATPPFPRHSMHTRCSSAECAMTAQVQHSIVAKRVKTLYITPNGQCRMRWKHNVMHEHSSRPSCA